MQRTGDLYLTVDFFENMILA